MNIHDLMDAKRRNEEIKEKHEGIKRLLLPVCILTIFIFWRIIGGIDDTGELAFFLIGLVVTIYVFYISLSAWIIYYIRKKGEGIYRRQNLFLFRQFATKVRTMQFTMGTLTALFTLALMGASIALMFSEYENTVLDDKFPFDVQIYSSDVQDDFADVIAVIDKYVQSSVYYSYHIYTDYDNQVNTWILTHLDTWGAMYRNKDGSPDMPQIERMLKEENTYYRYDTYMGISDYNSLRELLGYDKITLDSAEYLVQVKNRLYAQMQEIGADQGITDVSGDAYLTCAGIYADAFSQDGHNGADYLIIVPDEVLKRMRPYYSEFVAGISGEVPMDLQKKLNMLYREQAAWMDDAGIDDEDEFRGIGSDQLIVFGIDYIPLFYVGLVFVCVAVTVLSVQQLSDSAKYKFRYDVLAKLGLAQRQIRQLILKQLAAFYLCPAILAMIISGRMILFISKNFVMMTGVPAAKGYFFIKSITLFFGIYLIYFAVTYICFVRNAE